MNTATAISPALQTGFIPSVAWAEMVEHRSYLVRFAQRKLRDPLMAEDVVHDVFEAVLSGRAVFAGRAALRSWLTAVLKNKIVDMVRRSVLRVVRGRRRRKRRPRRRMPATPPRRDRRATPAADAGAATHRSFAARLA